MSGNVDIEALEIELLLTGLVRQWGYDFRNYVPSSLRRRVRKAMELEKVRSVSRLQERLLRDADAMQRFVSTLSVHVTAMFRDPPFYVAFRERVVPLLRTYPFIRIWHAGCSTGEEAYSLAILLAEEGLYDRTRIYATDMSDRLLKRAKAGIFPLRVMKTYTQNYQAARGSRDFSAYYTADDENAIMARELRRNIVFSQHNLAADGAFNEFHAILCRNVLIYFDDVLRTRVHTLFYESLARFGVLGLGLKESLRYSGFAERYEAVDPTVRLYRRLA